MAEATTDGIGESPVGAGGDAFSWLPPSVLAEVIAVVADGVLVVDASGAVLAANDAFGRLSGHEPWELVGASAALFGVDGVDDVVSRSTTGDDEADAGSGRMTLRRRGGASVVCDVWLRRVEVDHGEVVVAAYREVETGRQYGDTFVDEVEARTHALVNSLAALRGYVALLDTLPPEEHPDVRARLIGLTGTTSDRLESLLVEIRKR